MAPTIASKPSTGLSVGFNSNLAFFSGDPSTTHISSISGGLRVSQKKQVLSGVRFSMFTADDRWFFQGDNRLSWTSLNTYALGADALRVERGEREVQRVQALRDGVPHGPAAPVRRRRPQRQHARRRPARRRLVAGRLRRSRRTRPTTTQHGLPLDQQTSGGLSAGVLYDTRDNGINAQRGWLASASPFAPFFDGFLGGDSTWQQLTVDVRTYRKLTPTAGTSSRSGS